MNRSSAKTSSSRLLPKYSSHTRKYCTCLAQFVQSGDPSARVSSAECPGSVQRTAFSASVAMLRRISMAKTAILAPLVGLHSATSKLYLVRMCPSVHIRSLANFLRDLSEYCDRSRSTSSRTISESLHN